MNDFKISCWEFEIIYQMMVARLHQEYKALGIADQWSDNLTDIIGYNNNEIRKGLPDLTKSISQHQRVVNYLNTLKNHIPKDKRTPSAGKIWKFAKKIKDKKWQEGEVITLTPGIYSKVFFLYLGYEDYEDWKKNIHREVEFKGYYYSINRKRIDDFDLKITVVNGKATASLHGFHDFDRVTPLVGEMLHFNQCWLARLKSTQRITELQLHTSDLGEAPERLLDVKQLFGILSGIGSEQNLLSSECVFLRKGNDSNLTDIKRYLNLRRIFYTSKVTQDNLSREQDCIFGILEIDKLEHLSGKTFRLLTLSPNESIIQSKLVINDDYSSQISVPEQKAPLSCRFSADNFTNGTLLIFVYYPKNTIYSMVAIDLRPIGKQDPLYKELFCIAEEGKGNYPFGNRLVMQEDAGDFDVKMVPKSDKSHVFNTPVLRKLIDELMKFASK